MSIPGERDERLERWLQKLRPGQIDATESCLDAETAAAWVGGGLSGDALQQAQTHLADCDRCQTLIGSLVRADVGGEAKKSAPARTWLRWLLPMTAAATAMIAFGVWATLPHETSAPVSTTVESQQTAVVAQTPPAPAPPDELSAQAQSVPREQPGAEGKMAAAQPSAAKAEESRLGKDVAGRLEVETAKGAPPPAAVAAAPPEKSRQGISDAAAAPVPARAQSQVAAADGLVAEIIGPGQSVRWRITGRQVQRSFDRGTTWESLQVGATGAFAAGSAPSRTVCWLVGRGGIVMVTTDATSFNRIPFPEPVDLIAVSASDARSAMVTTSDGRTFRTSDGGSRWTR